MISTEGLAASATRPFRPGVALLYLVGAHIGFTLVDASGKYLAASMGVPLITLARHSVQVVLMLLILAPTMGWMLVRTRHPGLQIARGLALAGFTLFFFTALRYLPIAEATAINFMTPFGVILLAGPLLAETITWRRWLGACLGFIGMLIIIRPGSGLAPVGILFAALTVACNIAFQLLTRRLSTMENQNMTIFVTAVVGVVVGIFMLPLQQAWGGWPQGLSQWQWIVLLSLGLSGAFSQWCLIRAYFWSSASFIAPLVFLQMIWTASAGWFFFGQYPDTVATFGIVIIVSTGVLTMWAESRTKGRVTG
ncbi:MAG: DMT family transporter [Burkholderiaceae bacterium]